MGQKWYMDNNISIFVNALIQNAVIFFKVFFLMFADLAVFLLGMKSFPIYLKLCILRIRIICA